MHHRCYMWAHVILYFLIWYNNNKINHNLYIFEVYRVGYSILTPMYGNFTQYPNWIIGNRKIFESNIIQNQWQELRKVCFYCIEIILDHLTEYSQCWLTYLHIIIRIIIIYIYYKWLENLIYLYKWLEKTDLLYYCRPLDNNKSCY